MGSSFNFTLKDMHNVSFTQHYFFGNMCNWWTSDIGVYSIIRFHYLVCSSKLKEMNYLESIKSNASSKTSWKIKKKALNIFCCELNSAYTSETETADPISQNPTIFLFSLNNFSIEKIETAQESIWSKLRLFFILCKFTNFNADLFNIKTLPLRAQHTTNTLPLPYLSPLFGTFLIALRV